MPLAVHLSVAVLLDAALYGLLLYALPVDVPTGVVNTPLEGVAHVIRGKVVAEPLIPKSYLLLKWVLVKEKLLKHLHYCNLKQNQ